MDNKTGLACAKRVATALVLTFGVYSASSVAGWLPSLSDDNLDTIRAASMARAQRDAVPQLRRNAARVHPLGVQVLFVEAQEQKKKLAANDLLAEVFLFDYQQVQASVELVDANTGALVSTRALDSVQLPLNNVEAAYATQLLRDNTDFFSQLNTEYQHQFNQALVNDADIEMKVSVWVPDTRVYPDTPCVYSRCALVSVFTPNHYNFSVEPVVDLVSGAVYLDLLQ